MRASSPSKKTMETVTPPSPLLLSLSSAGVSASARWSIMAQGTAESVAPRKPGMPLLVS